MNAIVNFVTTISIANIHPFEDNPYKLQDNEEMQFLCESIRENGVLSPLLVRKIGAAEEYEVISGHRRLYAAHKLGLTGLPTVRPQRRRYRSYGQAGHKFRNAVSDTDSGRQVQHYIRLTCLIPELLNKLDTGEMALSIGAELSYLDEQRQAKRLAAVPGLAFEQRRTIDI